MALTGAAEEVLKPESRKSLLERGVGLLGGGEIAGLQGLAELAEESGHVKLYRSVNSTKNRSDGLAPCADIHELENPVNMIADGKLGKIQLRRDFLVGKAFCQKIHKLALAKSEIKGRGGRRRQDLLG